MLGDALRHEASMPMTCTSSSTIYDIRQRRWPFTSSRAEWQGGPVIQRVPVTSNVGGATRQT
jgi:hypothetical protein